MSRTNIKLPTILRCNSSISDRWGHGNVSHNRENHADYDQLVQCGRLSGDCSPVSLLHKVTIQYTIWKEDERWKGSFAMIYVMLSSVTFEIIMYNHVLLAIFSFSNQTFLKFLKVATVTLFSTYSRYSVCVCVCVCIVHSVNHNCISTLQALGLEVI